jgi:hypothetical protein
VSNRQPMKTDQPLGPELRSAVVFCFWLLLLGPVIQIFVWTSVEGFSVPWEKLARHYLVVLVHFLCYTPLFVGGLLLVRLRRLRLSWVAVGLGTASLAGLCSVGAVETLIALGIKPRADWSKGLLHSTAAGIVITAIVLYLERLYHSMVIARLEAQRRELDRERAQRTAMEAQWNSLESRVRPHFLFNTLSSIRELMHQNVAEADVMIQHFAHLIRFSLDSSRHTLIPLEEELRTVSQYLEIEKMRLGFRLNWRLSTTADCGSLGVPALSVLTLVENSVKHVVASRRLGGCITINAKLEGDRLYIDVCDDGPGIDESSIAPGHGLDLLLRRLESLYPGEIVLQLGSKSACPARVSLALPARISEVGLMASGHGKIQDEQTPVLPG